MAESETLWTAKTAYLSFRVWEGKLWRREIGPYFGGYLIKCVSLANERLVREWLA